MTPDMTVAHIALVLAVLACVFLIPWGAHEALTEFREWRANRPTPPGTELLPLLPTDMRAVRDEFTTGSIAVVTHNPVLEIPADSEELIALTTEAAQ